jgi:ABC-2 type transport system ATP-binding protein
VANEETPTLLRRIDEKELDFVVDKALTTVPDELAGFRVELTGSNRFSVHYSPEVDQVNRVLDAVRAAGLHIVDLSTSEADLEDIFMQLTNEAAAEQAAGEA